MRNPKVGDKIVITRVEGEEIAPALRTVIHVDHPIDLMNIDSPVGSDTKDTSIIETHGWLHDDEWRYAVREGDLLVVTRINGEDVIPTFVTAAQDEEFAGREIFLDSRVINNDDSSDLLLLEDSDEDDVWYFDEDFVYKPPIDDICGSFNEVESPDKDDELGTFGQSYSEFNASSGGGKTLKDYTGVDITKETLAFKGAHEKVIEGITEESLSFNASDVSESIEDVVNRPSHYNYGDIEVIDFIEQVADAYEDGSIAYMIGNTLKYVSRAPHKNGLTDLKKAAFYLNRSIERLENG